MEEEFGNEIIDKVRDSTPDYLNFTITNELVESFKKCSVKLEPEVQKILQDDVEEFVNTMLKKYLSRVLPHKFG